MNFLHREITFHKIEEYQTFENLLQIMKNEELETYQRVLHRIQSIDAEFQVEGTRSSVRKPHCLNS